MLSLGLKTHENSHSFKLVQFHLRSNIVSIIFKPAILQLSTAASKPLQHKSFKPEKDANNGGQVVNRFLNVYGRFFQIGRIIVLNSCFQTSK